MKVPMKASERCFTLIKSRENFSPIPYPCPSKVWTIGWGHAILPNEKFDRITKEQGDYLLKKDVEFAENCINSQVNCELSQNQFDALVSFVFNVGRNAFINSTMLRLINTGDLESAAKEFDKWVHSGKNVLSGLVVRRAAEKQLFLEVN